MTADVGVVLPAFRPDTERLVEYVDEIQATLDPAVVRIELDDPDPETTDALANIDATVNSVTERRGKGAAITAGFDALDTDVRAFVDADGSTPASELDRIVDAVQNGADIATGSRRHPDATIETDQPLLREIGGQGFPWLARRILTVSLYDYQCGAKAVTADAWQQVRGHLTSKGFAWDVELLAFGAALDLELTEVPITWHNHPESTVPPLKTAMELGRALVRTRIRTARLESNSQTQTP